MTPHAHRNLLVRRALRCIAGLLCLVVLSPVHGWARQLAPTLQPPSFFELYRPYVVGGLAIFAAQLALTAALLVQRVRRRRAEDESRKTEERYRSVVDTQSELICRFL